jgi:predicted transcriptional regulator
METVSIAVSEGFPMKKRTIDRLKVKELCESGFGVVDIAKKLGCTKGAVSKALKQMNLSVAKAVIPEVPKYVEKKDAATEHLFFLVNKAKAELDWIEKEVPPKTDAEYRLWQDQKIKFAAEMRKLITAIADIGYKLFQVNEMAEVLKIIDEEIGNESPECQQRIRDRLARRRSIRFPDFAN